MDEWMDALMNDEQMDERMDEWMGSNNLYYAVNVKNDSLPADGQ